MLVEILKMKRSRQGALIAILWSGLVAVVRGDCGFPSAEDCLKTTDIQQLPSDENISLFCSPAASLAYKVSLCLDECGFTPTDAIQKFLTGFENVCSDAPGCKDVGRFYEDLQGCFNRSGGLSALISDLVTAFNQKESIDKFCRYLAQWKNCMRLAAANCSVLAGLMNTTFDLYEQFAIAQHICGSENVQRISNNSNCAVNKEMTANIYQECDVSCNISSTDDAATVCGLLQSQIDCFLRQSEGCTQIERRFVLPRLNTYSIVNVLLDCPSPIQLQGVNIQPTGLGLDNPDKFRCKYSTQLNDCFNFNLQNSVRPDVVVKLINGNFLVDYFCQLKANGKLYWDQLLTRCVDSFLRCRLPVAGVYERASTYDDLYAASLAPFPLDFWGLNTILSTLQCPYPAPQTLCNRSPSAIAVTSMATQATTRRSSPILGWQP